MIDRARPRNIVDDIADLGRRIRALERGPATQVIEADAGGLAWNVGNPNWIDPTQQAAWIELRVSNTDDGSHIFRNCGGQWKQITT